MLRNSKMEYFLRIVRFNKTEMWAVTRGNRCRHGPGAGADYCSRLGYYRSYQECLLGGPGAGVVGVSREMMMTCPSGKIYALAAHPITYLLVYLLFICSLFLLTLFILFVNWYFPRSWEFNIVGSPLKHFGVHTREKCFRIHHQRDFECENTSLQNVELENCVLSHHIIVRYR